MMPGAPGEQMARRMVTFFHDIEQDLDNPADPATCRQMVTEFLALEKKYHIRTTYNIAGHFFAEQPEMVDRIRSEGHEVAFHSYHHHPDWHPRHYAEEVRLCRNVSAVPVGYRSPRSLWDRSTLSALWESGFVWNAESDPRREPYLIHRGLVRLPIAGDDWPIHTGELDRERWVERFRRHLRRRPYVALGSHDVVASLRPEELLAAWEEVIRVALDDGALVVTFAQAADLYRRSAICRHYAATVGGAARRDPARGEQTGGTLHDLILSAARGRDHPVITLLGYDPQIPDPLPALSGMKILRVACQQGTTGLYPDPCETVTGDPLASPLPDQTADAVITHTLLEYLLWPEDLFREIARIGKAGAPWYLILPGDGTQVQEQGNSLPDLLRRYQEDDEVSALAARYGLGPAFAVANCGSGGGGTPSATPGGSPGTRQAKGGAEGLRIFSGVLSTDPEVRGGVVQSVQVGAFPFAFRRTPSERLLIALTGIRRFLRQPRS
jgi:peptidoglycan/xylan/chitin deacetylase (PgdA/CDA1 family)